MKRRLLFAMAPLAAFAPALSAQDGPQHAFEAASIKECNPPMVRRPPLLARPPGLELLAAG